MATFEQRLELGHHVKHLLTEREGVVTGMGHTRWLGGEEHGTWVIGFTDGNAPVETTYIDGALLMALDKPPMQPQEPVESTPVGNVRLGQQFKVITDGWVGTLVSLHTGRYLSGHTTHEYVLTALAIEPMMPEKRSILDFGMLAPHGDKVIDPNDPETHAPADHRHWNLRG